jgi:hypothetical protein
VFTTQFLRVCDAFHSRIAYDLRDRERDGTSLIAPINRPLISMIALAITRGMGSMSYDAAVIASHVDARARVNPGVVFAVLQDSTFAFFSPVK